MRLVLNGVPKAPITPEAPVPANPVAVVTTGALGLIGSCDTARSEPERPVISDEVAEVNTPGTP